MRKSLTMVLGTVFCLSVASTALAASGNLFTEFDSYNNNLLCHLISVY